MCTSNSTKEIYTNSSSTVHLYKETKQDQHQERSTTRRYHIAQAVYGIFRRLTRETRCLKIESEYLSRLRFADDILICTNTPHELQQMLHKLAYESENQGLKMNKSKTKVMMEIDTPIYVNNTEIEIVESYIYLGQRYSTRDTNQDKGIQRRITAGWTAFANKSRTDAYFQQWHTAPKHGHSPTK